MRSLIFAPRLLVAGVFVCGGLTLFPNRVGAQAAGTAETPLAATATPATTPATNPVSFAERMKVALSVRVIHSILEVSPGMRVDEAREKLAGFSDPAIPPVQEGGEADEGKSGKDHDDTKASKDADADADDDRKDAKKEDADKGKRALHGAKKEAGVGSGPPGKKPLRVGGDDDDAGQTRILWKLKPGSPYEWVFIEAGKDDKIAAVFGYCWPDKPIPFGEIGDVSQAPIHTPDQVAWDSMQPPLHFRIYATGAAERAAQVTVTFFALQRKSGVQPGER